MGYFFYYAHGSITVIQYKFLQTGKKKSCLHQCLRPEYKHSNRTQTQSLPLQSFPIKRPHSSLNNGLYFEIRYLLIRSPPYQFPFLQNGIRNQYRHAKYSNQNPGILNDTCPGQTDSHRTHQCQNIVPPNSSLDSLTYSHKPSAWRFFRRRFGKASASGCGSFFDSAHKSVLNPYRIRHWNCQPTALQFGTG